MISDGLKILKVKDFNPRWDTLIELIKENNFTKVAEIGVETGITARHILDACNVEAYFAIDPAVNKDFFHSCLEDKISFFKMTSEQAAKFFSDGCLDLVFIDASHLYPNVKQDIQLWSPKIRKGGIISGHDYNDFMHVGVKQAVDEIFASQEIFITPDEMPNGRRCVWWVQL